MITYPLQGPLRMSLNEGGERVSGRLEKLHCFSLVSSPKLVAQSTFVGEIIQLNRTVIITIDSLSFH